MSEIILDPPQQAAWQRLNAAIPSIESWARRWRWLPSLRDQPRSLYLHGPVGRGKSMLMDRLYQACTLAEPLKRRIHFYGFMAEVNDRLKTLSQTAVQDRDPPLNRLAASIAAETRLLCFDELVINNIADAMILGRLLPMLIKDGVVIITTSNFAPERLYDNGLLRERFLPLIELIEDRFDLLDLGAGTDWRKTFAKTIPCWFTGRTINQLPRAWLNLIGDNPIDPFTLQTAGRTVTISKSAEIGLRDSPFKGLAAWFDFAEVCQTNLGPRDYLAMSQAIGVVFIDQIPQFKGENFDSARRFISLVDSLYESRCGLVASSSVEIDQLYPITAEQDSRFPQRAESNRCMSRLHEMQSSQYQAAQKR
ncbi:MAG: cell division protein ZapE [Candidatus Pacebacteria bacterium]|nr:cell division protein ZapE [Candidatus Paceibacterota bacterium]